MVSNRPISVLIVDDSAVMRNLIGKIIGAADDLVVAGKALNGTFALQKIPVLKPDVIVLDLEMPDMNGIDFLRERKARGIDVPVVILSSRAEKGAKITMEALFFGASDFIMKPTGASADEIYTISETLVHAVRGYGRLYQLQQSRNEAAEAASVAAPPPVQERRSSGAEPRVEAPPEPAATIERPRAAPAIQVPLSLEPRLPRLGSVPIELVAIGVSTGGPNALREVFAQLDADLGVPIAVVQHMPPGFTAEFARSLDKICPLEVKEASDGDLLKPGRILIAPGSSHIRVERRRLAGVALLGDDPVVNGHRPSADVLFDSVGEHYGAAALAIIMTGMGKDGARAIGTIYKAGGMTIAQDEETSVVFGMPKAAIEGGCIQYVLPLAEISNAINRLVKSARA